MVLKSIIYLKSMIFELSWSEIEPFFTTESPIIAIRFDRYFISETETDM